MAHYLDWAHYLDRMQRPRLLILCGPIAAVFVWVAASPAAVAATIGPPMFDVTRQCSAVSRRNVAAMSECVVAESEARAEILQKWVKLPDASAQRCTKLGRKTQKYPYVAMAKCLAEEPAASPKPAGAVR